MPNARQGKGSEPLPRRWRTAAMLTHWFTDVPVAGHDRDLVRALSLAVRWIDDEEPPCHIGLLGDDGRLYRIVIAHGEPQRTAVEATLRSFGYRTATTSGALRGRLHVVFQSAEGMAAMPPEAADPCAGVVPEPDSEP